MTRNCFACGDKNSLTVTATLMSCSSCGGEWGRCNGVWITSAQPNPVLVSDAPTSDISPSYREERYQHERWRVWQDIVKCAHWRGNDGLAGSVDHACKVRGFHLWSRTEEP